MTASPSRCAPLSPLSRLAAPAVALALAAPLTAQGGPWKDGELLVRSQIGLTSTEVLYRIEPETGNGVELTSGFFWAGHSGGYAFDPYRGGVLACMGIPPSIFFEELFLVDENGGLTIVPGFTDVRLRAIAPTGDGKVYLQRYLGDLVEYLDENDALHVLMDDTGAAPFLFPVEHLLYHPPTHSLIGSISGAQPNTCITNQSSIWRIPLSPDGSQVGGPVVCDSITTVNSKIVSLDYLPGGDLLVQMEGGQFFNESMVRVDPVTLQSSVFASPQQGDINGTVWSSRIGKAVLLDDGANELRLFSEGQSGVGTLLPSNVTVSPSTTGSSPVETIIEIDLFGPGCAGTGYEFGDGLAGTGAIVPRLYADGCPDVGNGFSLRIDDAVGGALGGLVVGSTQISLPLFGGTFHVLPILVEPVITGGASGAAGAGSWSIPVLFGSPSLVGTTIFLQAGFFDAAAVEGVSLTNALQLVAG